MKNFLFEFNKNYFKIKRIIIGIFKSVLRINSRLIVKKKRN